MGDRNNEVQTLVLENLGLIGAVMRRGNFHLPGPRPQSVDGEDMWQVGALALVEAARAYRPERGKFASYAARKIHGELMRAVRAARFIGAAKRDSGPPTPVAAWPSGGAPARPSRPSDDSPLSPALLAGLGMLHPRQRIALLAVVASGRSPSDVDDEHGWPAGEASRRSRAGLKRLRNLLAEDDFADDDDPDDGEF